MRILLVLFMTLTTTVLAAQDIGDVGGFLGADVNSLLNIPAPRGDAPAARGGAARGAQPNGRGAVAPPVDRLAGLRTLLMNANSPLSPQQEAALNALLNSEIPLMRQALQARVAELQKTRGAAAGTAPAGTPPTPAAGRGLPPNLPNPDELVPDLNRLNDQLVGKIADSPALTPDQQSVVRRALRDQIRSRGGFDALNLTMQEAGSPFSADQATQIQTLFTEQNRLRAQIQPPDPAKITLLERETLTKVLRLLTPPQRAALTSPAPKPPQE